MKQTFTTLLGALAVLLIAADAHAFYNPGTGRWLNRDPLGESGGMQPYQFAKNRPTQAFDPSGLWAKDIHQDATERWAKRLGYPAEAAWTIGAADEEVDHGGTSFMPVIGDQSYHFNRNKAGRDSRLQHFQTHFNNARRACTVIGSNGNDDPHTATKELGTALHPLQDWVAHGDYGIYDEGGVWAIHNEYSPQATTWGEVTSYPDLPYLDAKNGPDGRPAGLAMKTVVANGGVSIRMYAIYQVGTRRLRKTKQLTDDALVRFREHLERRGGCECKRYFGVAQ